MADNHDTPLSERLDNAFKHVMEDKKVIKRLRFTVALLKVGGTISERQAEMLATDMLPYLEKQGIVTEDYEETAMMGKFQQRCMSAAWAMGDVVENFKVMKEALKHKKG